MIMIFCQNLARQPGSQGLHVVHGIEQHRILGICTYNAATLLVSDNSF